MKVQEKIGGAERKVKAGERLSTEVEVSRTIRIEKGEVGIPKEKFKGATTGVDNGVSPERVSTVEVADNKKGRREAGKEGTEGIKVYRLRGGKIEGDECHPSTEKDTDNRAGK